MFFSAVSILSFLSDCLVGRDTEGRGRRSQDATGEAEQQINYWFLPYVGQAGWLSFSFALPSGPTSPPVAMYATRFLLTNVSGIGLPAAPLETRPVKCGA